MATFNNGYSGGMGGVSFADDYIGKDSRVVEIRVSNGVLIDAIQLVYETGGGIHDLPRHGGTGGRKDHFALDKDEYITGISGKYGKIKNGAVVHSLQIHTNKQTSKKFGGDGGVGSYAYQAPPGARVVGFWGRAGSLIDAIGVIFDPLAPK